MNANPILLQKKYARIVEKFADREGISLDDALKFFYHSEVYDLMSNVISDMHCISDVYLIEYMEADYKSK